jgi:8-oxo-dGTP diphosphatase
MECMGWSSISTDERRATGAGGTPRYRRGAKAHISTDGAILLIRERHADGTPFWTLPGGGVAPSESLAEGLRRELHEELGCQRPVIGGRVGQVWYAHRSNTAAVTEYTVFECQLLTEPTPDPTEGVEAARWLNPEALPPRTLPQVPAISDC